MHNGQPHQASQESGPANINGRFRQDNTNLFPCIILNYPLYCNLSDSYTNIFCLKNLNWKKRLIFSNILHNLEGKKLALSHNLLFLLGGHWRLLDQAAELFALPEIPCPPLSWECFEHRSDEGGGRVRSNECLLP